VPYDYLDLDRTDVWQLTEAAEEFAELMDFIDTLPFKATGRMLIIYDDSGALFRRTAIIRKRTFVTNSSGFGRI
jgi:hypothetical protein